MEIVKDTDAIGEVVNLAAKKDEGKPKVTPKECLETVLKTEPTDVVIIARGKEGEFAMSMSVENGMLAYFMMKKAAFAMEHSIL